MIKAIVKKYTDSTSHPIPRMPASQKALLHEDEEEILPTEKIISAGTKAGLSCFITYQDSKGQKSQRRITVKDYKRSNDDAFFVSAFCHERKALRSFRVDRIHEVIDIATGEIINDKSSIQDLFHDEENHSKNVTLRDIRKHRDALNILAFLSRCDGRQHPAEREIMLHYMVDQCFEDDLEGEYLEKHFKRLYPTDFVFHACVQSALEKGNLKTILKYAVQLAEADGILHEKEHHFLEEMQDALTN